MMVPATVGWTPVHQLVIKTVSSQDTPTGQPDCWGVDLCFQFASLLQVPANSWFSDWSIKSQRPVVWQGDRAGTLRIPGEGTQDREKDNLPGQKEGYKHENYGTYHLRIRKEQPQVTLPI